VATISAVHADYCIAVTEDAIPHYDGPDLRKFGDRIEIEFDNIRSALAWSLSVPDAERSVRLAGAIWRNWWSLLPEGGKAWNEGVAEGKAWVDQALALREGLPVQHVAEALMGAGKFSILQGDPKTAMAYGRELLERSNAERYAYGTCWAHLVLGSAAHANGELAQATMCFKAALMIAPTIRDPENHAAMALMSLGAIALEGGDFARAEPLLTAAVTAIRICGNLYVGAEVFHQLGCLYRRQGKYAQAAGMLAECLDVLSSQRDLGRAKGPMLELSEIALGLGQPNIAIHLLAAATQVPDVYWPEGEVGNAAAPLRESVSEPRFSIEWTAGEQMPWDEVMTLIGTLATDTGEPMRVRQVPLTHGLSPREIDVLRLLVDGHANRAIGETLSISERTVEAHVQHILAKLNLESRTGAATYAVRHGPV